MNLKISFFLNYFSLQSYMSTSYLPLHLFGPMGIKINMLTSLFILYSSSIYIERKKEIVFLNDFLQRVQKLQDENMINLKNKL